MNSEKFSLKLAELPQSWQVQVRRPKVHQFSVDTLYLSVVAKTLHEATQKAKEYFSLSDEEVLEVRKEWKALL